MRSNLGIGTSGDRVIGPSGERETGTMACAGNRAARVSKSRRVGTPLRSLLGIARLGTLCAVAVSALAAQLSAHAAGTWTARHCLSQAAFV